MCVCKHLLRTVVDWLVCWILTYSYQVTFLFLKQNKYFQLRRIYFGSRYLHLESTYSFSHCCGLMVGRAL